MPISRKRKQPKKTLDEGTARLHVIDPTKGFVEGNVEWIHKDIEAMMGDLPTSEFIRRCFNVANNFTRKFLAGNAIREDIRVVVEAEVERLLLAFHRRGRNDLGGNGRGGRLGWSHSPVGCEIKKEWMEFNRQVVAVRINLQQTKVVSNQCLTEPPLSRAGDPVPRKPMAKAATVDSIEALPDLAALKAKPGFFERIWLDRQMLLKDAIARRDAVVLPEDFLIDEKTAMKRLGISEPTIKRRRKAGTLKTVPIEGTDIVRYSNNYISKKLIPR
jgi:hypothetical protein